MPGTLLSQHRLGSTLDMVSASDRLVLPEVDFQLDFTSSGWSIEPALEVLNDRSLSDVPWLQGVKTDGHLINFRVGDQKTLYVPCIEFFARCYGHSTELQRVLLTYQWPEVEKRIFHQPPDGRLSDSADVWIVHLGKKMNVADRFFLAHIKNDEFTRRTVLRLCSEREVAWDNGEGSAVIQVGPWFEGPAQLRVRGYWITPNAFLAVRVDGGSLPTGPTVHFSTPERPRSESGPTPEGTEHNIDESTILKPAAVPSELTVHADRNADSTVGSIVTKGTGFVILGPPRDSERLSRSRTRLAGPLRVVELEDPEGFATSDPYASGSDAGQVIFKAETILESKGALRDMWNALKYVRGKCPDEIGSVEWYTPMAGFSSKDPPHLVAVYPPKPEDGAKVSPTRGNWHLYNPREKEKDKVRLRGVLAVRVIASDRQCCILEIERRPRAGRTEERYSGLAFPLKDPDEMPSMLQPILESLPLANGVFAKIEDHCPDGFRRFSHRHAQGDDVAGQAAALNALAKMDIKVNLPSY